MALANMGFKRPKLVSFRGRRTNRMGRRRREEEEEEEEEKKRKRRSSNKGMELWILYGSHGIVSFI